MSSSLISAIGTAVPQYKQSQEKAALIVAEALSLSKAEARFLKSVYRSTGIKQRHSVVSDFCKEPADYDFFPKEPHLPFPLTKARMAMYEKHALPLALQAIKHCFGKLSDFNRSVITHVVTVSCTGMYAPGIDIEIIQALQLSAQCKRTCINFMGCYGVFNALKLADAICKAQHNAVVLIVSIELCTLHFQQSNVKEHLISNAIFSDGAAAALVSQRILNNKYFKITDFHCDLIPQYAKEMAWSIANNGFDIVLSSYVPQAIESGILSFMTQLMTRQKLTIADIKWFAIHPGGQKILAACESALGITPEDNRYAYSVLQQFGNMSSATVLFVLHEIFEEMTQALKDQTVFSCAFGPGLTLESMLLQMGNR